MQTVYNFSPGPAMLPPEVMQQVKEEMVDWHGTGMSIIEMSHRGKHFLEIAHQAEADLRDILNISNHYHILFLQGGAQTQFSSVPLNLLGDHKTCAYLNTGHWSALAIQEAKRYAEVAVVADASPGGYVNIPDPKEWHFPKEAAYLYYVDNETIQGLEFPRVPEAQGLPLVSDMSSNMLSRPFDINQFALVYAAAQKNIGPAGLTLVILHEDMLKRTCKAFTPKVLQYGLQVKKESMLNTPPTFSWYVSGLVFQWIKAQGGLEVIGQRNQRKAEKLYAYIDQSNFYHNPIEKQFRSNMNVIFDLADTSQDTAFVQQATGRGLLNIKGHRDRGGMRASLYNAMPEAGVDALIAFMKDFEKSR